MSPTIRCDALTQRTSAYDLHRRRFSGDGSCSRPARWTDGRRNYCTQHAGSPATLLAKRDRRIRPGLTPINP